MKITKNSKYIDELLKALASLQVTNLIFTGANADSGGELINKKITLFVKSHSNSVKITSMGTLLYLSTLKYVDVLWETHLVA